MSIALPPVLIVDDEKNMRQTLTTMLRDEDYETRAADSAEEALRLLAHEEFLMVITDARLGGMSGYELLPKIRAQWPDLPTLMLTAYATPKLAVEAIKAGAMDYLSKPFAPEELLTPWAAAPSAIACSRTTNPCAPAPRRFIASSTSSAKARRCARCAS